MQRNKNNLFLILYSVIMRFVLFLLILLSSVALARAETVVIHNVHLLTMESNQIIENQTVIISEGVISWVGNASEAEIPDNATVIEGDFYVMPGLAEMHAHIPSIQQGRETMENTLKLYLSQGITTIRGMLGQEAHLELREQAAASEIISPRIFTSGPSFSGNSVNDPERARQMVRDQKEAGYDLLKIHPGITLDVFEAVAHEANKVGIEFSGHISHAVGLERSLDAGQGTIEHLDRYMEFLAGNPADREDPSIIFFGYDLTPRVDESLIEEAVKKTKAAGVWNVPTNTLLDNIYNPENSIEEMKKLPGMKYMPPGTVDNWANFVEKFRQGEAYNEEQGRKFLNIRNNLTKALHENDAGLMLGADAPQIFNPPGFSAHRELELFVDAGLSPFEALKTGTVNVGKYLGEENTTGKIAEGFRADLVLLNRNPLETIPFNEHIQGVVSQGIYYDRATIDSWLETIREE